MPLHRLLTALVLLLATQPIHAAGPIELATGTPPNHPQQPQVAVDEAGAIHVVYGLGNSIRYCRSDDGGKTFSQAVTLPAVNEMSLGMRRGPRVAAGKDYVCVTAIGGKKSGKGRDGEIFATHSIDKGQSWSNWVTINDVPAAAREGLHAMATGPKGELYCVWLDLRTQGSKIFMAKSTNGGQKWSSNQLVYESPDGHVCECCHPTVAVDSIGGLAIMWRNWLGGARDMYLTTSPDGGETFSKPWKVGQGTWRLNACPMDGGAYAGSFPGGPHATVWRRGDSVFLAQSGVYDERLLGRGEQPWIASANGAYYIVWLKKRGETLYLLRTDDYDAQTAKLTPVELAPHAADPAVAASVTGSGPVIAVWEARENGRYSIQCQVLAD